MKLSIVSDFRLRWQRFFAVQRQSHETITKEQQMVIQFLGDRCGGFYNRKKRERDIYETGGGFKVMNLLFCLIIKRCKWVKRKGK